jgi:type I restriction enzyme S subunit
MKSKLLKELCYKDRCGVYGIPASAEDFDTNKTRYLRITDISEDGKLINENKKSVSSNDIEKYILEEGDLVFARTGNSTGKTYYHEEKNGRVAFAGFLIKYSLDPKLVNPKYLRYYTITKHYKEWVDNFSLGSTRGNINAQSFGECPIPLPNRTQQDFLVKVLSDLDAKIELNNKINAELEAMVKLIYDYWFVQFEFPVSAEQAASMGKPQLEGKPYKSSGGKMVWNDELKREVPEGWDVKNLGRIGNFKNGVNYDPSNPGEIACPIINVRNISSSRFFLKNEDLDIIYLRESDVRKYSVHSGSIIIARSGIPGATRLISDMAENTLYCGFAIHYELEDLNLKIPVFFFLKSIEQQIQSGSGGTILKNVNQATLNDLKITLPEDENIIKEFNNKIEPLFAKINLIQKENQKLAELRDWLLPMLMNGQVKVDKLRDN